jgi:hypothetical protein
MKTKGLSVEVYRYGTYDCTNNGISAKQDNLILVDTEGPFIGDETNSVKLVKRNFGWGDYVHAEPIQQPEGMVGPMFGGNFIYSSDSRFPAKYPIPIHDRFETQEMYDALSI